MFHPQCGHDTALAWREYPICGENGSKPELSLKVRHLAFGRGLLRHAMVRGLG